MNFLMVIMTSGIARGRVRTATTTTATALHTAGAREIWINQSGFIGREKI